MCLLGGNWLDLWAQDARALADEHPAGTGGWGRGCASAGEGEGGVWAQTGAELEVTQARVQVQLSRAGRQAVMGFFDASCAYCSDGSRVLLPHPDGCLPGASSWNPVLVSRLYFLVHYSTHSVGTG